MTNKKSNNQGEHLFGTDGIRGPIGVFPLDESSILKIGRAIGEYFRGIDKPIKIVFGFDTRGSSTSIESLLATGIVQRAAQTVIYSCGVIPTPGLSFVTRNGHFDYGIMITASHNPYTDNGIKMFGSNGEKISQTMEGELEDLFYHNETVNTLITDITAAISNLPTIIRDPAQTSVLYYQYLTTHVQGVAESRFKIVLDCAHGATYQAAPNIFRELFPNLTITHAAPDGRNINFLCGSTHTTSLSQTIFSQNADIGIAFDGDGDRVLFVDNCGRLLDGDFILFILASYFLKTREDFKDNKIVVGTVMANLALEKALQRLAIGFFRTEVGDKYVYRELKQRGAILGGEQSGHIVLTCFQPTGDGILTALYFLKALAFLGLHPSQVVDQLQLYPQVMKNIPVTQKKDLQQWEALQEMINAFNETHHENSRLLIRYSGTEPLIRIMMESQYSSIIEENMDRFEQLIRSTIGSQK